MLNWSKPIDGVIHVPDELDKLVNSIGFQVKLHTISKRTTEPQMVCNIAYIAQKFFYNPFTDLATEFFLGKSKLYNRDVFIQQRRNSLTEKIYWAVTLEKTQCWCLGTDENWHFEYMPSSRTDEFIRLTRFETKEQAYDAWIEHEKKGICLPLYA